MNNNNNNDKVMKSQEKQRMLKTVDDYTDTATAKEMMASKAMASWDCYISLCIRLYYNVCYFSSFIFFCLTFLSSFAGRHRSVSDNPITD